MTGSTVLYQSYDLVHTQPWQTYRIRLDIFHTMVTVDNGEISKPK